MNAPPTASAKRRQVSGVRCKERGNLQFAFCILRFAIGFARPLALAALFATHGILLASAGGCAPATVSGYDRYVPTAELAETALRQVLDTWKSGQTATELAFRAEPITLQVADTTRRPGQRLVDYELLGEVSGEGPRVFVVRLKLDNPRKVEDARYYLVGIDPLWVFRQEDYDALAHWDACIRAED